jgi:hypothetical protein
MDTHPGSGKRISNRSAVRLRYFGLGLLVVAFAIEFCRALGPIKNDYSAVAH